MEQFQSSLSPLFKVADINLVSGAGEMLRAGYRERGGAEAGDPLHHRYHGGRGRTPRRLPHGRLWGAETPVEGTVARSLDY